MMAGMVELPGVAPVAPVMAAVVVPAADAAARPAGRDFAAALADATPPPLTAALLWGVIDGIVPAAAVARPLVTNPEPVPPLPPIAVARGVATAPVGVVPAVQMPLADGAEADAGAPDAGEPVEDDDHDASPSEGWARPLVTLSPLPMPTAHEPGAWRTAVPETPDAAVRPGIPPLPQPSLRLQTVPAAPQVTGNPPAPGVPPEGQPQLSAHRTGGPRWTLDPSMVVSAAPEGARAAVALPPNDATASRKGAASPPVSAPPSTLVAGETAARTQPVGAPIAAAVTPPAAAVRRERPRQEAPSLPLAEASPPLATVPTGPVALAATGAVGHARPAAPPSAPTSEAPSAALVPLLNIPSDRLGDVGIGIEGGPRDLRVSMQAGPAAVPLLAADAPRLVADLAAIGVRLQSLDVAGTRVDTAAGLAAGAGPAAGTPGAPQDGGGQGRSRPQPSPVATPAAAFLPLPAAVRIALSDRFA